MAKLGTLQAFRGLAVMGIVLFHLTFVELKNGSDRLLPLLVSWAQLGVDLFFVISGFVMVMVTRECFGKPREIRRFLFNRVARIYPVYWLYFFIALAIYIIKPQWVNASHGVPDIWASFFLLPSLQVSLVMVSWTLSFELWFYLVFAALMFGSERRLPVFLLGWAAILLGYNLTQGVSENPYLHLILHPFALEFICGAMGALLWRSGRLQRLTSPCLVLLIGAALLAAGPLGYHLGVHQAADLLRMVLVGLAFATLVTGCVLLEQRGQLRIPLLCSWLGDASYTIYLSHLLVLGVISFGWKAFGSLPNSLLDNAIAIGAALVAVVIYGLLAYRFFERPMVVWANRLSRGWFRRPLPPAPRPV